MRHDVLVIGAGLAGSITSAVLGRAGLDTVLIDRHAVYPPDFRAEQLVDEQPEALRRLGLLDGIVGNCRRVGGATTAGHGRILHTRRAPHYGIRYDNMVNAARALATQSTFVAGRVTRMETGPNVQSVHLADGTVHQARLLVVASGPNCDDLLATAGIRREVLSAEHSLTFGFDISTDVRGIIAYQGERTGDGMDYLVFFPMNGAMRANLFAYRKMDDPWVRRFREEPKRALLEVMPGLEAAVGPFAVEGKVQVRPNSIKRAVGAAERDGLLLLGDAYQTPCPAVGLGVPRTLADVETLRRLLPAWLATPGMTADKISQFYRDPVKSALDARALRVALYRRALCTETSLGWRARRLRVYCTHRGRGFLQAIRHDRGGAGPALAETSAGSVGA